MSFFRRGQYSDAVLSELENQNDAQIEGMSAKVKMLKDVRLSSFSSLIQRVRGQGPVHFVEQTNSST